METISIEKFREKIGWTCANYPYCNGSLSLVNGCSCANIDGARICGEHYSIFYKYQIVKGVIYFPIIFAKNDKCFIAHNEKELNEFMANRNLNSELVVKKEIMSDDDYAAIRNHEIRFANRFPFTELYNWHTERFFGYEYVEI